MELTWSIDEVARTSDDTEVRRRFSERNRRLLIGLLILFGFFGLANVSKRHNEPFDVVIAAFNVLFVAASLFLMRYTSADRPPAGSMTWRIGGWLHAHMSAVVLACIAVQHLLFLIYTRNHPTNWKSWTLLLPMMMVGFRMLVSELVLLHGFLFASSIALTFIAPPNNVAGQQMAIFGVNAIALTYELYASHRLRRKIVIELTPRRASAREQVRMRDELRYARELQLSMLPECAPRLPFADICSISVPATEVGGDYYDYFIEDDRIALVCGDVAGHGMAAGLVLSALRSGFTLLRDSLGDPAAVLRRLHTLVADTSRRRMFVTVSVVLIDSTTRKATIASAGHPPVILRHADGTVEAIDLFAPPLGVRLPLSIPQRQIDWRAGDVFVLHSDGIYEARNDRGEDFGLERLVDVVATHGHLSAEALRDAILRDVAVFRGAARQADDVTVVVCRMR